MSPLAAWPIVKPIAVLQRKFHGVPSVSLQFGSAEISCAEDATASTSVKTTIKNHRKKARPTHPQPKQFDFVWVTSCAIAIGVHQISAQHVQQSLPQSQQPSFHSPSCGTAVGGTTAATASTGTGWPMTGLSVATGVADLDGSGVRPKSAIARTDGNGVL